MSIDSLLVCLKCWVCSPRISVARFRNCARKRSSVFSRSARAASRSSAFRCRQGGDLGFGCGAQRGQFGFGARALFGQRPHLFLAAPEGFFFGCGGLLGGGQPGFGGERRVAASRSRASASASRRDSLRHRSRTKTSTAVRQQVVSRKSRERVMAVRWCLTAKIAIYSRNRNFGGRA